VLSASSTSSKPPLTLLAAEPPMVFTSFESGSQQETASARQP
jgi:hypothetical protein